MKEKEKSKSTVSQINEILKSIGYFLAILFCALRACGVIAWNWFWIMAPIFTLWAIGIICILIGGILAFSVMTKED